MFIMFSVPHSPTHGWVRLISVENLLCNPSLDLLTYQCPNQYFYEKIQRTQYHTVTEKTRHFFRAFDNNKTTLKHLYCVNYFWNPLLIYTDSAFALASRSSRSSIENITIFGVEYPMDPSLGALSSSLSAPLWTLEGQSVQSCWQFNFFYLGFLLIKFVFRLVVFSFFSRGDFGWSC